MNETDIKKPSNNPETPTGDGVGLSSDDLLAPHRLDGATDSEMRFLDFYTRKDIRWGVFFMSDHHGWSLMIDCTDRDHAEAVASQKEKWKAMTFEARIIPDKIRERFEKLDAKYFKG